MAKGIKGGWGKGSERDEEPASFREPKPAVNETQNRYRREDVDADDVARHPGEADYR